MWTLKYRPHYDGLSTDCQCRFSRQWVGNKFGLTESPERSPDLSSRNNTQCQVICESVDGMKYKLLRTYLRALIKETLKSTTILQLCIRDHQGKLVNLLISTYVDENTCIYGKVLVSVFILGNLEEEEHGTINGLVLSFKCILLLLLILLINVNHKLICEPLTTPFKYKLRNTSHSEKMQGILAHHLRCGVCTRVHSRINFNIMLVHSTC